MDSTQQFNDGVQKEGLYASVDPFLVEALQNSRHRLTILRMELDVQKFLKNPDQLHFEFQHFPTSYLRLAAHRVAQHYGLVTSVLDNGLDPLGSKIAVMKTSESKYPSVCLSEIPAKQPENNKLDQVKIAIKPRPNRNSGGGDVGIKQGPARTVEERKEEYDRARARIFSSPSSPTSDDSLSQDQVEVKNLPTTKDNIGGSWTSLTDTTMDRTLASRDLGTSSRVAIFRDREKDRTDPDYDRSYERYVRSFPASQRPFAPFNAPNFQPVMVQYNAGAGFAQMPRAQSSMSYGPSSELNMNQFSSVGMNQPSRDGMYVQWPSPAMMYAQSYEPFRHTVFQAPFCQQPLSFDYSQNHHH